MKEIPVISVIVVNYNGLPYIDTCLTSILNQSRKNYEVIFVDNASSDGSKDYVREKYPGVIVIPNTANTGYCGGINTGFSIARGKYIAPVNIDTEVKPEWLSAMQNFMEKNDRVGAVTPKILLMDSPEKINTMGLDIHISGLAFCHNLGKSDNNDYLPEKVTGISGCSFMIRKETLAKIGGMPEECFMANDDVILSWLINIMGLEIYSVPQSVIYHRYHPDLSPAKLHNMEKNRLMLLLYTLKTSTLVLFLLVYFVLELFIMCYCLLKGLSYFKAKLKAYSMLWKERRVIKIMKQRYAPLHKINDFALLSRLKWKISFTSLNYVNGSMSDRV